MMNVNFDVRPTDACLGNQAYPYNSSNLND